MLARVTEALTFGGYLTLVVSTRGVRDGLLLRETFFRKALLARIRREAAHAGAGRAGRLIAKMNGLVDPALIEELYAASRAGVEIDLIVRGICCLRPGVPGLSERIRVRSIVDRYLEHARIFYFENAGEPEYLLASADWMPRNLDNRVEIAFPVLAPALQAQLRAVLDTQLADNVKARIILPDGRFERVAADGGPPVRSQDRLYELTGAARDDSSRSEIRSSEPAPHPYPGPSPEGAGIRPAVPSRALPGPCETVALG